MRTKAALCGAFLMLGVVGLGGCSSPSAAPAASNPPAASTPPNSASSRPTASTDLAVADSPLGKIIVDKSGRTAYYFTKDKAGSGKSVCSGQCLVAWPSIAPSGAKPTAAGITAKLGTITRDDGTKQVTVDGLPIYLYVKDTAAGDVTGQGVGNVWYVIAPDGTMITKAASGS